jgi:phenylalanyl-tRNA synthetase alpha chain
MQRAISAAELARDLELRDLTDAGAGPHAIQVVVADLTTALCAQWACDLRVHRGERVVTVADNYDRLGFSADVVTRDARYTRYVDERRMLRSHSSAIVPAALEQLALDSAGGEAPEDVLLACPGICYRRDSIDWQHTGTPHQLDLWRVAQRPLLDADLDEMIDTICRLLAPGRRYRCEGRVHPYTLNGRQVDVDWDGRWVEIAECGLTDPALLERCGLGDSWSGLALGTGLDRDVMLAKGIPDVRLLRSNDPRVRQQMLDLEAYCPVSAMPAIRRDLSVAVDESDQAEDLGDRVRDALGSQADVVEEVAVVSTTAAADLPAAAQARLGIRPGQVNLLVRVSLRALDRTLSAKEANELRNRVYAAIHRGTVHTWAGGSAGDAGTTPCEGSGSSRHGGQREPADQQADGDASTPIPEEVTT